MCCVVFCSVLTQKCEESIEIYEVLIVPLIALTLPVFASRLCERAFTLYMYIIPTSHHYAYFEQFDWLEKTFYTSINSMSMNFGIIFLPPTPKMCNNVGKRKFLMTKAELYRFYRCVNSGESLTNLT